jgi:hypothetical protein
MDLRVSPTKRCTRRCHQCGDEQARRAARCPAAGMPPPHAALRHGTMATRGGGEEIAIIPPVSGG